MPRSRTTGSKGIFAFEIPGIEDLLSHLDSIPDAVVEGEKAAANRAATAVADLARSNAPKGSKSPHLADGISHRVTATKRGKVTGRVFSKAPHASAIEFGVLRPVNMSHGRKITSVFGKTVSPIQSKPYVIEHPNRQAHPYLVPAAHALNQAIQAMYQEETAKALEAGRRFA